MKSLLLIIAISYAVSQSIFAQKIDKNIPYRNDTSNNQYLKERCVLDIYAPSNNKDGKTLIFFHGGGLTGGEKYLPQEAYKKGIITIAANYRLSPLVHCPIYIEDAAAAVAWTYENIEKYGGDKKQIYISGESAGAYLVTMLALDKSYLAAYGIDADCIAGYIPISGQMTTHFTVLNERGISSGSDSELIDQFAPFYHVRRVTPTILFVIGDRTLDMPGRYLQNRKIVERLREKNTPAVFWEMKTKKHTEVTAPALSECCRLIANDSLSLISDSIFFNSETKLRNIYDSQEYKQVNTYSLTGRPIEKEEAYSRTHQIILWRSVDTTNHVKVRKILRK